MTDDFFADLSETIQKAAKEFTEKTDSFFEGQKAGLKLANEERMVEKCMESIGNIVYRRHVTGEIYNEEIVALCEEVTQHKVEIARLREEMAKARGEKTCPECGASISRESAFCMYCGTACAADEEPEDAEVREAEPEECESDAEELTEEAEGEQE